MSRGAISHYSSRNLDACTLQLNSWNPFVSPSPASIPSSPLSANLSCPWDDDHALLEPLECRFRPDLDGIATGAAPLPVGLEHCLVKCSFKHIMGRGLGTEKSRWSCASQQDFVVRLDCQTWDPSRHAQDLEMIGQSGPTLEMIQVLAEETGNNRKGASNSSDCDKVSRSMKIPSPNLSSWSKRHKQLSRALARGLWRWREGARASKRRRKAGSSRSGSGRSSDSRRAVQGARMYASDPSTVGAPAAYATCSDIPMPGTDSSGELFFFGEGNGINWEPDDPSSGEGVSLRRDGIDLYHAWFAAETQSLESGYGSEPGYRGDVELGYGEDGVPDEQDEEEKEQLHLSPWRDTVTKAVMSTAQPQNIPDPEMLEEDHVGDPTALSDLKMQHRLRRRRQDWRQFNGQKSRHL